MKTPITLWELSKSGNPYDDGWVSKHIYGQFVEKTRKTEDKSGAEVTSYARFTISENLNIKEIDYKLELGHSLGSEPSLEAYKPISSQGNPTIAETRAGETGSEWVIYV
jgi:hypothetical protein